MHHPWKIRWHVYLPQLVLICCAIIVFFTVCYWSINALNWGWILNRESQRENDFLGMLYFSMGTFFRIGYGDQVPVGLSRWFAGLEALSNYLVEVLFISRLIINMLEKFISFSIRQRLENIFHRHE
jgi:hypothetical protein